MRISRIAIPAVALALVGSCSGVAFAAPAVPDPPSVAQICAATGIAEVDALLDGVASSDLVGALEPLATLIVPQRDTVELDASVQLNDVRQRLNCDVTTTPATPTPLPIPTTTPLPSEDDDFSQIDRVPTGAAETGGGPVE